MMVQCLLLWMVVGCNQGRGAGADDAVAAAVRVGDPADWCVEHALPESMCTKCAPALVPAFQIQKDWCAEHGFPESSCPVCNPMKAPDRLTPKTAAAPADWCGAHALPESMCTKCNPELEAGFKEKGDWCEEHGYPESACPTCNPIPLPEDALAAVIPEGTQIRLASVDIVRDVGIKTIPAGREGLAASISVVGTLDFDQNRMAQIQSPVPGIIREVQVDLGDQVQADEAMFIIENTDVAGIQAKLQAAAERRRVAHASFKRAETLHASGAESLREFDLTRQELSEATAELRYLRDALKVSGAQGRSGGRLVVRSPTAGTVVRRPAMVGMATDGQTSLATVADLSQMWVLLDVPEADATRVKMGQTIDVKAGNARYEGVINWLSPEVDHHTRTVRVRAVLPNAQKHLRANQFVRARLTLEPESGAVVVPREALQRHGESQVVFVKTGETLFEPRAVAPLRRRGKVVEVRGELKPGEPVVTTGAFLLKTELSKESIGAGCCEIEPRTGE